MRRVLAGRGDRGGFPDHVADSPCKMRREVCGLWCWPSIEPLDVELLLLELLTLLDPRLLQPSALLPVKVAVDDDVLRWLTSPAKERLRASTPPGGGSGERRAFNLSPSDMSWLGVRRSSIQSRRRSAFTFIRGPRRFSPSYLLEMAAFFTARRQTRR